jgi:3-hydroxy acid dehydrogenase/malonic semialdehyde reductase
MKNLGKIAFITGATAGIGLATAYKFADNKWHLILTGRRTERLQELKDELTTNYPVEVYILTLDVRDYEAVEKAIKELPAEWRQIDLLLNNAGLAKGVSPIHEGSLSHWEQMIDTNIKGLLYVTRLVAPMMVAEGKGHIINVGSLAGKEVYPNGNVYAASKHFVDALTRGMRIDLLHQNVKVSQVAPGLAETEFSEVRYDGDKQRAEQVYKGFRPLTGADIADVIFWQASAPDHVNIADVLVIPADQANSTTVNKSS